MDISSRVKSGAMLPTRFPVSAGGAAVGGGVFVGGGGGVGIGVGVATGAATVGVGVGVILGPG